MRGSGATRRFIQQNTTHLSEWKKAKSSDVPLVFPRSDVQRGVWLNKTGRLSAVWSVPNVTPGGEAVKHNEQRSSFACFDVRYEPTPLQLDDVTR